LDNFGYPTVGGFKDLPGELSFEFLTDMLDFRLDLIQFMDIKRRGKSILKRDFAVGRLLYHNPLKFPESASVYPTGQYD